MSEALFTLYADGTFTAPAARSVGDMRRIYARVAELSAGLERQVDALPLQPPARGAAGDGPPEQQP
jgi:hypothetical protein